MGIFIKRLASNKGPTLRYLCKDQKKRIPTGNLLMTAPILETIKKLKERKYLKTKGARWNPQSIPNLTLLPIKDMILRYRTILNGFLNYYSFVDNRKHLAKIY